METRSVSDTKDQKLCEAVVASRDYREFLANVILATTKQGEKPNVAALSRRAGFSSRSFIGDVINGRRRLSAASYPKLARALKIPARAKNYFHLLVVREEPELNFEGLDPVQIESKLKELRSKLVSEASDRETDKKTADVVLKARHMMDCYAALGSIDKGSTAEEVSRKTELPVSVAENVLKHFLSRGIAESREGRFYPANTQLLINDLGENFDAKSCYLFSVDELRRKANAGYNRKDRAFHQFVFTVEGSRMPALKQKLWEMLREFMETNEQPEGGTVVKLVLGFYS